ncbi:hypothetical protein BC937DRAFT_89635 [Endogone sp. FLAS-F59071]|nr:hypothetical protein BC937DRAFT_89635 [Endogone sp. FLAS-F59071]|eukprot:RUS22335.1 hypothetical protein BC937DRAFT_89635 [Endogone sp. FLAS-F59071]
MGPKSRKKQKQEDFKHAFYSILSCLFTLCPTWQKPKLKVGKKKAAPDNFTDTSFKSKGTFNLLLSNIYNFTKRSLFLAISLPNQSIADDKSDQLTNARNLTLNDLVTQLRHYNAGSRKDAIQGLRDLFNRYPALLPSSLSTIVNALVRLLIDDDGDVRKALWAFLKEYLATMDKSDLQPFLPLLIIYTCSAITHIHEDIRLDAIKFMDLWIDIAPQMVVGRFWKKREWMERIISCCGRLDYVNESTYSALPYSNTCISSLNETLQLKMDVLNSLYKFLDAGVSENVDDHYWFFQKFLASHHARQNFTRKYRKDGIKRQGAFVECNEHGKMVVLITPIVLFFSQTAMLPPYSMCDSFLPYLSSSPFSQFHVNSDLNLFGLTGTTEKRNSDIAVGAKDASKGVTEDGENEVDTKGRVAGVKDLISTLQPILLATWLDAAPTVFSASGSVQFTSGLQTVHLVLKVMAVLWRAILSGAGDELDQAWVDSHLQKLLKHFMIYFPFGDDTFGMRDSRVESILQEMNILFCELTSLFLLATTLSLASNKTSHEITSIHGTVASATAQKSDKRRKTKSNDDEEGGKDKTPAWAEEVVEYVLKVLGWEVGSVSDFKPEHFVALLPTLWSLLNSLSEEKQEWLFEIQSDPQYTGRFRIRVFSRFAKSLQAWVLDLPKLLWELKAENLETSRVEPTLLFLPSLGQVILEALRDVEKRQAKSVFEEEVGEFTSYMFDTLQKSMIPFFYVNLPNKGTFSVLSSMQCFIQVMLTLCLSFSKVRFSVPSSLSLKTFNGPHWNSSSIRQAFRKRWNLRCRNVAKTKSCLTRQNNTLTKLCATEVSVNGLFNEIVVTINLNIFATLIKTASNPTPAIHSMNDVCIQSSRLSRLGITGFPQLNSRMQPRAPFEHGPMDRQDNLQNRWDKV